MFLKLSKLNTFQRQQLQKGKRRRPREAAFKPSELSASQVYRIDMRGYDWIYNGGMGIWVFLIIMVRPVSPFRHFVIGSLIPEILPTLWRSMSLQPYM